MNVYKAEKRYINNPQFKVLVDALQHQIEQMNTTVSEVRDGLMLTQIRINERRLQKYFINHQ